MPLDGGEVKVKLVLDTAEAEQKYHDFLNKKGQVNASGLGGTTRTGARVDPRASSGGSTPSTPAGFAASMIGEAISGRVDARANVGSSVGLGQPRVRGFSFDAGNTQSISGTFGASAFDPYAPVRVSGFSHNAGMVQGSFAATAVDPYAPLRVVGSSFTNNDPINGEYGARVTPSRFDPRVRSAGPRWYNRHFLSTGNLMSGMFGGFELGSAYITGRIGQQRADLAMNPLEALRISAETTQAQFSGVFGSIIGAGMDLFGAGPASLMGEYDKAAFRDRLSTETRSLRRSMELESISLRSAGERSLISRVENDRDLQIRKIGHAREDLEKRVGEVRGQLNARRRVQIGARYITSGGTGGGGYVEVPTYGMENVLQGSERAEAQSNLRALRDSIAFQNDLEEGARKDAALSIEQITRGIRASAARMRAEGQYARRAATGDSYGASRGLIADAAIARGEELSSQAEVVASMKLEQDQYQSLEIATGRQSWRSRTMLGGDTAANLMAMAGRPGYESTLARIRAENQVSFMEAWSDTSNPQRWRNVMSVAANNLSRFNLAQVEGEAAYKSNIASMDAGITRNLRIAAGQGMIGEAEYLMNTGRASFDRERDPAIRSRIRDTTRTALMAMRHQSIDSFYAQGSAEEISGARADLSGSATPMGQDINKFAEAVAEFLKAVREWDGKVRAR